MIILLAFQSDRIPCNDYFIYLAAVYNIFNFYMSWVFFSFSLLHFSRNSDLDFSAFQQARCFLDHVRSKGESAAKVLLEYIQQQQESGSNLNQKTQTLPRGMQFTSTFQ